jgi:hypothetical protein
MLETMAGIVFSLRVKLCVYRYQKQRVCTLELKEDSCTPRGAKEKLFASPEKDA